MTRTARPRQEGFALLLTVMLLLMLASLAVAGLETVQRDQQVSGHLNRKQRVALHAADAGLAKAMETLNQTGTPTIPTTSLADGTLYPHGQPSYQADTSNGPAVENLGAGGLSGFNLQPNANGNPQFQVEYYKIRVQGNAPGGSLARLEFATGSIVAN